MSKTKQKKIKKNLFTLKDYSKIVTIRPTWEIKVAT